MVDVHIAWIGLLPCDRRRQRSRVYRLSMCDELTEVLGPSPALPQALQRPQAGPICAVVLDTGGQPWRLTGLISEQGFGDRLMTGDLLLQPFLAPS